MILVASYCRVSTDQEDQANSFASQQRYFREYIDRQPDWELYRVYADEGITGTSTKKRTQFNQMIRDARKGKFQLIITKEVSRFSRNILDTIAYTRQLRAMGVAVHFVLDGINTMNPDSELYLSIMSSMAQEESRKTSARVVWGQTRQMEKGVVFGPSLLGYQVSGGKLLVEPGGAGIVRLIFHKYALEQVSTAQIARFLNQEGIPTPTGKALWKPAGVVRILKNEKYVGDLIQKKTYTPDYLTHEKRRNHGQVPMIRIENHHESIISRQLWDLAQNRLRQNRKQRATLQGHSSRYVYSGKIRCGECGSCFTCRCKVQRDGTKLRRWSCGKAAREGREGCRIGTLVRDDDAMQMLRTALQSLCLDRESILRPLISMAMACIPSQDSEPSGRSPAIESELDLLQRKKEAMMDSYFAGEITRPEMLAMKQKYDSRIEAIQQTLLRTPSSEGPGSQEQEIRRFISGLLSGEGDSDVFFKSILESLTVFRNRRMELRLNHLDQVFVFSGSCGRELSRDCENADSVIE